MADNAPTRDPIKSTVDKAIDRAVEKQEKEQGESEAEKHGDSRPSVPKASSQDSDNGRILKIVGGVVAVVAAIALGSHVVKQRKSNKDKAKDEAGGLLDEAGKHLRGTGRWFGEKAESAKDKAGEVADDARANIKGATDKVVPSSVSTTAANIKDRANVAGIKAEREGLKASEKSDAAVRGAADKLLTKSGKAADKADAKSGGFFSGIRNWLGDRKDDAADAAGTAANKVGDVAQKAGDTVKGKN